MADDADDTAVASSSGAGDDAKEESLAVAAVTLTVREEKSNDDDESDAAAATATLTLSADSSTVAILPAAAVEPAAVHIRVDGGDVVAPQSIVPFSAQPRRNHARLSPETIIAASPLPPSVFRAVPQPILAIIATFLDPFSIAAYAGADRQTRQAANEPALWRKFVAPDQLLRLHTDRVRPLRSLADKKAPRLDVPLATALCRRAREEFIAWTLPRVEVDPRGFFVAKQLFSFALIRRFHEDVAQQAHDETIAWRDRCCRFACEQGLLPLMGALILLFLILVFFVQSDSIASTWPLIVVPTLLIASGLVYAYKAFTNAGRRSGCLTGAYIKDSRDGVVTQLCEELGRVDSYTCLSRTDSYSTRFKVVNTVALSTMILAWLAFCILVALRMSLFITCSWLLVFLPAWLAIVINIIFVDSCCRSRGTDGDRLFTRLSTLMILLPLAGLLISLPIHLDAPTRHQLALTFLPLWLLDVAVVVWICATSKNATNIVSSLLAFMPLILFEVLLCLWSSGPKLPLWAAFIPLISLALFVVCLLCRASERSPAHPIWYYQREFPPQESLIRAAHEVAGVKALINDMRLDGLALESACEVFQGLVRTCIVRELLANNGQQEWGMGESETQLKHYLTFDRRPQQEQRDADDPTLQPAAHAG